ncbi:MAG: penicillin acylase family protein [Myxococcota bacterium]|nr:penicillin acylase family protein [Myxococcota bacterium]
MRVSRLSLSLLLCLSIGALGVNCPLVPGLGPGDDIQIPGLQDEVRVVTDRFGIPHVFARNDADLVRVQGWLHARDRLYQMDSIRRQVDGTLSELRGPGSIGGDIQGRTFGLHRAAARSLASIDPELLALLDAYAEGVNAWIDQAEQSGTLPPEYAALELTTVRRWVAQDTAQVGKALAAQLSLDIDLGAGDDLADYVSAGDAQGFDGAALFFEDVQRLAPMDPAAMVPDATGDVPYLEVAQARRIEAERLAKATGGSVPKPSGAPVEPGASPWWRTAARHLVPSRPGALERLEASRMLSQAMNRDALFIGSNEWVVGGSRSQTGYPILANDPHLGLDIPATFYEIHLVVEDDPTNGDLNIHGVSLPGAPLVVQGQNEFITFGSTTNPMDVSDVFDDSLVISDDPVCTSFRLCIETEGRLEPVSIEFVAYDQNDPNSGVLDDVTRADLPITQSVVLTVPFRSFGPVIDIDDANVILGALTGAPAGTRTRARVLQYTGFHDTRELETFSIWARAHDRATFEEGLQRFDFGSQNWSYADAHGEIAIYTSAELPLRKDLEAGDLDTCAPPFFVRDGSGPCNWVPDPARSQGQTIPFAVLPFEEMPQVVNPASGFIVNANNDPAGVSLDNDPFNQRRPSQPGAVYYLNPSYSGGWRAGRITQLVRDPILAGTPISADDMKRFQANTQQRDAELMTPFLLDAFDNADAAGAPAELQAFAADPRIVEAIGRLEDWDYSAPTGIVEGWDAQDSAGERSPYVSVAEIENSIACTIYNVWRGKAIRTLIDGRLSTLGVPGTNSSGALKALHNLLDQPVFTGVGASGVDFFPTPVSLGAAEDRRDHALLQALADALDALAGPDFQDAFGGSTDQDDYRWGRLHRITFDNVTLRSDSIPSAAGFDDLDPNLPGLARDGGYNVVNASGFSARAVNDRSFRFGGGPNRRYVGVAGAGPFPTARIAGVNVVPGGTSGIATDPTYAIQLATWLTSDYHPVEMFETLALRESRSVQRFVAEAE